MIFGCLKKIKNPRSDDSWMFERTCACASSLWVSFPSIPAPVTSLKHWIWSKIFFGENDKNLIIIT